MDDAEHVERRYSNGTRLEAWKRGGHYVGWFRTWTAAGKVREEADYGDDGLVRGTARLFNNELQRVQEQVFVDGVVQLTGPERTRLAQRLGEPHVTITDVVGPVVPQSQRLTLVWDLWRGGELPLARLPALWQVLFRDQRGVDVDDVLRLLRQVGEQDPAVFDLHLRLLPTWTVALDALVMRMAHRGTGPYLAALGSLAPPQRDGLRTVLIRLGLPHGTVGPFDTDVARELAALQVRGHGRALVCRDDQLVEVTLHSSGPTEEWAPFVEQLVDLDQVRTHVVAAAIAAPRNTAVGALDRAWLAVDDLDILVALCTKTSPPFDDYYGHMHQVLSTRHDRPEALVRLATAFEATTDLRRGAWAELARLYALARGADPALLDRLAFSAWTGPSDPLLSIQELEERWFPIVDALPREAVVEALRKQVATAYLPSQLAPFVARYGGPELWEALLVVEEAHSTSALRFRGNLAEGFGRALGRDDLPWLHARIEATEDKVLKNALVWAMLRALVRLRRRPEERKPYVRWKLRGKDRADKEVLAKLAALQKKLARWGGAKATSAKKPPKRTKKSPLADLAAAQLAIHGDPVTVELLVPSVRKPGKTNARRVGGVPIGVSAEQWPTHQGERMLHVITLPRADAPACLEPLVDEIVAVAVFADERTPRHLEVVHLSAVDLAKGSPAPDPLREQPAGSYRVTTLQVPSEVFDPTHDDPGLSELRQQLRQQPGLGGGLPLSLPPDSDVVAMMTGVHVLCEVDERLVSLSLAGSVLQIRPDGASVV